MRRVILYSLCSIKLHYLFVMFFFWGWGGEHGCSKAFFEASWSIVVHGSHSEPWITSNQQSFFSLLENNNIVSILTEFAFVNTGISSGTSNYFLFWCCSNDLTLLQIALKQDAHATRSVQKTWGKILLMLSTFPVMHAGLKCFS